MSSRRQPRYEEPTESLLSTIWLPCSFFIMLIGVMGAFVHRHFSMQPSEAVILPSNKPKLLFNDMDFIYNKHQCADNIHLYSRDFYTKCGHYFSFSKNYYHSRERFRNLSKANQLYTKYKWIDKKNDLSMDFTLIPGSDPSKLLIYICGVHGVESLTGSSIMLNLLMQHRNNTLPQIGPNILFIHGYNAYGFANKRRTNKNNVDLNRNVLLTEKEWNNVLNRDINIVGYEDIKTLINIAPTAGSWIDTIKFLYHLSKYFIIKGKSYVLKALLTGQYHDKKGMFYGGTKLQKEHKLFYKILMENKHNIYNINTLKQVIIVDIHSGLGPYGLDTLMIDSIEEYEMIKPVIPRDIYNVSNGRLDVNFGSGELENDNIWDYSLQLGATSNWCKIFTKKMNNDMDENFNKDMLIFYEKNIGK
eukprot:413646_1